jgi:hypothetical protein
VKVLNSANADTPEADKARVARRKTLLRAMTIEERRLYVDLLRTAAERQAAQQQAARRRPAAIETESRRVLEESS